MHAVSTNQIAGILHFNNKIIKQTNLNKRITYKTVIKSVSRSFRVLQVSLQQFPLSGLNSDSTIMSIIQISQNLWNIALSERESKPFPSRHLLPQS